MLDADRLILPDIPADQRRFEVAAWMEPVEISTYEPAEPDRYPAYLHNRVYQGSSGQVYPLPFIESIALTPTRHSWVAVHLENEYLRLMILPELGGRVHVAADKTSGGDFFYRNNVIKPALVGLAGPWISGGIEFNWPQHHRPGTYLPTDWTIEREDDGAVTVWCSDHDPFARMKGMHGIRLRPGSSLIEARVRLFNRTEVTQTFLWWANVAVHVHDRYQSFFPTDVHVVADHAKRAMSTFPAASGLYYGVNYPGRVDADHPDADRLDWYRNIPVPTSYMCIGSEDDFFGGYDHEAGLGFVHVADHRIAPGKKQWTWGNAPFGWAWDHNLTDTDGPYVELMAGVYTDNQPDFSYLVPGETKSFSQFWYPFHRLGVVQQATTEAAVRLEIVPAGEGQGGTGVSVGVAVTRMRAALRLSLTAPDGHELWAEEATAAPGKPVVVTADLVGVWSADELTLTVRDCDESLIEWRPRPEQSPGTLPQPATALPAPAAIESADELYLAGVHLAQYHHASRAPEPYWEELLSRDPLDSRANVALAARRLADGRLDEAESHLRLAIQRETRRNPNPADGEAHYLLGIVLNQRGRTADAYDALSKSLWNAAWRAPGHLALARIDAAASRWTRALDHATSVLTVDADNLQAANIAVIALRSMGRFDEAEARLRATRSRDRLDWWSRDLAGGELETDARTLVDVAIEYESIGRTGEALRVLDLAQETARLRPIDGSGNPLPLIGYRRARLLAARGDEDGACEALRFARTVDSTRCFAGGLADALLLEAVLENDGSDARAHALLGHWLYFHRRYDEAISHLRRASELDPGDPVVWRGLGLAAYNVEHDLDSAAAAYARAVAVAPDDPKLLYEADQLARRRAVPPTERLAVLEGHRDLVARRDDLTVVLAELLVLAGRAEEAVAILSSRRFQPWEGGEGEVLRVWSQAQASVAAGLLSDGRPSEAVAALRSALETPASLGEARHALANCSDLLLAYGDALEASGEPEEARHAWRAAAASAGDFTDMATVPFSTMTYHSVLAARRLGDDALSKNLTEGLLGYIRTLESETPSIDYFATSLPTMLIFDEDLDRRHTLLAELLTAQFELLEDHEEQALRHVERILAIDPADVLACSLLKALAGAGV